MPLLNIGDNYIEQPVLIKIVEVADEVKQGRQFGVQSVVRLRSLDSCLGLGGKRGDLIAFPLKGVRIVGDWELNVPRLGRRV